MSNLEKKTSTSPMMPHVITKLRQLNLLYLCNLDGTTAEEFLHE